MRRLYITFRALIHELAKFGIVGAANYVLDVALSNWLHFGTPHLGPLTSKAISTAVAATSSYYMNRHWTWRHRARTGVRREYSLFILLSVVGFLITEACVAFSEYALGLHSGLAFNLSANVVGVGFGMVWRFWSFKRWVFLPEPQPASTADVDELELERAEETAEAVVRTTV